MPQLTPGKCTGLVLPSVRVRFTFSGRFLVVFPMFIGFRRCAQRIIAPVEAAMSR